MQATQAVPIGDASGLDLFGGDPSLPESHAVDPSLVVADQTDLLYRRLPGAVAFTLLAAAATTFIMWPAVPLAAVLVWWGALAGVSVAQLAVRRAYRQRTDTDTAKWLRWFAIGVFGAGATWGFAGAVLFPAGGEEQRVFLAFVLASMVSGGIALLSAVWQVYAAYTAAFMLPIAYVLLAMGSPLFLVLGIVVPVLLVANITSSIQLSRAFGQAFRMRRAYRTIADEHAELNAQLQEQIEQLARAHEDIRASSRKLSLYIDRAPIAVFELDESGTVLNVNPAAETLFGYPGTEIEGRSLLRTLFPADRPLLDDDRWRSLVEQGVPIASHKAPCLRRDGLEIMCEFSLTPLVGAQEGSNSIIVHCQDITRQVEADRLKQEFTSTLSHELRTPLTSIIGSLQLINTGVMGDLDKEVLELTQVAERNGQRLLDMINDILDIEKIESGRFTLDLEALPLPEVVREAMVLNRGYADRFKVSLEAGEIAEGVPVRADRKRLLQVLTNLISNAAKFSPEHAKVEISLRRDGENVRVWVDDRGAGIPPEFRGRIFSRFAQADASYTRKKGGTGLGLAISKRLAEMMGGSLGFADREGGGTRFFLDLPVLAQTAGASE